MWGGRCWGLSRWVSKGPKPKGGISISIFKKLLKLLLALTLAGALLLWYAFGVEPHRLTVERHGVGSGERSLTVLQISDLELSENYTADELEKLLAAVEKEQPDLIVFTGDLFSNYSLYHPTQEVVEALSTLSAPYGKFAVWGNNDYGGGAAREYPWILEAGGFTLLKNQSITLALPDGGRLLLVGLDDSVLGHPRLTDLLPQENTADFTLLLTHEPWPAQELLPGQADLVLAGHTHGGQVRIPFLTEGFTHETLLQGLYQLDNAPDTLLFVNSGLGTSRMGVRFLVPPQIAVFTISY